MVKYNIKKSVEPDVIANVKSGLLHVSRDDKLRMKSKEVDTFISKFENKYKGKGNFKYYVRVFTPSTCFTIKSFNGEYDEDMIDDYLQGKVKNKSNLNEIVSFQIGYFDEEK
jgi:hypothetical protein